MVEVDYVYTRIPNAVNNRQNNLRIATGVTYHFGSKAFSRLFFLSPEVWAG